MTKVLDEQLKALNEVGDCSNVKELFGAIGIEREEFARAFPNVEQDYQFKLFRVLRNENKYKVPDLLKRLNQWNDLHVVDKEILSGDIYDLVMK